MRRSTDKAGLALAVVASSGVRADRCRPAGISKALVQIRALGADGFEAILAETLALDAFGIVDAIEIRLAERGDIGLRTVQRGRRGIFILFKFSSCPKQRGTLYSTLKTGFPPSKPSTAGYPAGDAQIRSTNRVK